MVDRSGEVSGLLKRWNFVWRSSQRSMPSIKFFDYVLKNHATVIILFNNVSITVRILFFKPFLSRKSYFRVVINGCIIVDLSSRFFFFIYINNSMLEWCENYFDVYINNSFRYLRMTISITIENASFCWPLWIFNRYKTFDQFLLNYKYKVAYL